MSNNLTQKKLENTNLAIRLHSLAIFRNLHNDMVIKALMNYLDSVESLDGKNSESSDPALIQVDLYGKFIYELYKSRESSLASYILKLVSDDENIYMRLKGAGTSVSSEVEKCLDNELQILQDVCDLTPEKLISDIEWKGFLPEFSFEKVDLKEKYFERVSLIGKYGYGMYAKYHMFYVGENGNIVPVVNPDANRLCDLVDYEFQRNIILQNTKALLAGLPAQNVLLTGDAGTGKSSTVKAIANELYPEGLRILEVRKEQLRIIPSLLDELTTNPLKFILFIDDLSFQKDDDNYSALKAILEGSVSAKSGNVVIYATSNRRHLLKERASDREGDDIHLNDTLQESISLSERFGIQLTFSRPDKATYLDIVHHLVKNTELSCDMDKLDASAEKFALSRGTRSARAAKQYVDRLLSGFDNDVLKM